MYEYNDTGMWKSEGRDSHQITNFTAEIIAQIIVHEGKTKTTTLIITGKLKDKDLPQIEVPAEQFATMTWVARVWGVEPIVMPVGNAERDAKTAIQMNSTPNTINVYQTTGWQTINGHPSYLHAGGAINKTGNNPKIRVDLPQDLQHFRFDPNSTDAREAFRASMNLHRLGPPDITWPLLLATYRAALGPADFAIHLAGRTGTFKTEICTLFQAHYGSGMTARNLPASWSSTANALEAQSYYAKHAIIVIDDFVPTGTAWQVRTLQKTCDQIIRGQGNQQGRARLSDRTSLQQTYYPRGIILSTGEDVPDGHSIRARMIILELTPGDIQPQALSKAQSHHSKYQNAMAHYIGWLAIDLKTHRDEHQATATAIRDTHRELGHTRTPSIIGQLAATAQTVINFGTEMAFLTTEEGTKLRKSAVDAILEMAQMQKQYLEAADPADAFIETIRQVLAAHLAHLKTKDGATPQNPELAGWTVATGPGGMPDYKCHGPQIGWTDWSQNELYVDINALMFLKRHAAGKLSMTRQTLLKRLKDSNILTRTEESRQRNTIRMTCERHARTVMCVDLTLTLNQDNA